MAGCEWETEGGTGLLWMAIWKGLCEWMALGLRKMAAFSAHVRQCKNEKNSYKPTVATLFYNAQTNVQQPFLNTAFHCELAERCLFFETSQSCVSTKITLSHRFKSSPAIPGNLAVPGATGYLMMADHFSENHESSGDLNRLRSPEVRKPLGYFWFFSYKRKE